jgi:DNA helicase-2/ATP-dependent DNA helicase PcrA
MDKLGMPIIGAAWNQYSFTKTLTPKTSGAATERQHHLSRKLAYVCFSRAEHELRIVFFTPKAQKAAAELIELGMFDAGQMEVVV